MDLLMFTPGPTEVPLRVLRAMVRELQNPDLDEGFAEFYDGLCGKLKRIMRTSGDVIIHSGEAIMGLEAAVYSLVNPGEKVLTMTSGVYGDGFINFVRMYGGVPVEVRVEYDEVVFPEKVEETLRREKDVSVATLVHCETPSGTLNPLEEIGRICEEHGVLLVVDAVSSVGGVNVDVDRWGVDICIVGSQKCFSAPPGLGIMTVSEKAWEKMEERRGKMGGFYLNVLVWRDWWFEKRIFPYTHSVSLLYALDEACNIILEEGLEKVFRRHEVVAKATREGVKAMGLKLFPKSEDYCSPTVTAVESPKGVNEVELRRRMREKYGVMIAGSWGKLAGRVFRLGHMGYNAQPSKALVALAALSRALSDMGFPSKTREALSAAEDVLYGD
ncbi:MAG: alanine--glyoxylate aminotransferase family protein [Candidatus Jordarchaeales archaeon]